MKSRFKVTHILIGINILFFVIASILLVFLQKSMSQEEALALIALKPSLILQGKNLWTFITSMFMHAEIIHLLVNMISLFFIGTLLEQIIGTRRFIWLYLVSGLFASVFFIMMAWVFFHLQLDSFAVGASGALFGLGGALMFLTPDLPVMILFIPIPIKLKYAMPLMLVMLWLVSLTLNIPIGNTAHLGGFIVGLVYGFYLRVRYHHKVTMIGKYFR